MMKAPEMVCGMLLLSTTMSLSRASGLEIGVRILFIEGTKRTMGLGNPCSPKEREMIKTAFRQAATTTTMTSSSGDGGDTKTKPAQQQLIHRTDRQLLSCSYLCEDYDTAICYLAHPHCAAPRQEDERDHHDEPSYLDPVGLQKFQGEHIVLDDNCDLTVASMEEKQTCRVQKVAIHQMITDWLVPHLSSRCNRLVQSSVDLTCFRL